MRVKKNLRVLGSLISLCLCLFSVGCVSENGQVQGAYQESGKYYPIISHDLITPSSMTDVSKKPTAGYKWEFQTDGGSVKGITEKYRRNVEVALQQSGMFSNINASGVPSDINLSITVNNVVDSLAGAYAQGFVSGLTLGIIGSKITDDYECTVKLQNAAGTAARKQYKYGITSTSGLIVPGVDGVKPEKSTTDAMTVVIQQLIHKSLLDFKNDGLLK